MQVFDNMRHEITNDRSQFYKDLAPMFYGANRPGAKVSQGTLDQFWLWSMQAGLKNAYESIKAFSETDLTEDLKQIDVPTLVMHGEDDQIVPVKDSAVKSARLIKGAKEIYYPGAPHGLTSTHQDQVNADLLNFLRSEIFGTRGAGLSQTMNAGEASNADISNQPAVKAAIRSLSCFAHPTMRAFGRI